MVWGVCVCVLQKVEMLSRREVARRGGGRSEVCWIMCVWVTSRRVLSVGLSGKPVTGTD